MKIVETLTIEEALSVFRSYGVKIAYEKLAALIDSGVGERQGWAVAGIKENGGCFRIIFRQPLISWLESLATEVEGGVA